MVHSASKPRAGQSWLSANVFRLKTGHECRDPQAKVRVKIPDEHVITTCLPPIRCSERLGQAYLYPTAGLGSVTPSQWYVRHLRPWEDQNTPSFLLLVSCFCLLQAALTRQGNRQGNKCGHAGDSRTSLLGSTPGQRASKAHVLCRGTPALPQVPLKHSMGSSWQLTAPAVGPLGPSGHWRSESAS